MKPCCEDLANRSEPETPNPDKPELTVTTCVCGARHFELDIDPIAVGVEVTPL